MSTAKVWADFNGLFSELLWLSHKDTVVDENGQVVALAAGVRVTAFQEDAEDGQRDDLIPSRTVEPSPDWLRCRGSRWVLRIDEHRVKHELDQLREQAGGL